LDIVGARQLSGARVVLRTFLRFLGCFRGKKIEKTPDCPRDLPVREPEKATGSSWSKLLTCASGVSIDPQSIFSATLFFEPFIGHDARC
jgi:hypothetical protein